MKTKGKLLSPALLMLLLALTTMLLVLRLSPLGNMLTLDAVVQTIRSAAPWSHLMFLLLQMGSVILAPIPSNLMATAGGICFGFPVGFAMTFVAVSCGSLLTFTLARRLGRSWVSQMVEHKISDRYLDLLQRKRDSFLVLVFLFPFFPDDLICILAGLTDIPFRRFALIVLLTRHWGLAIASLAGGNLTSLPGWTLPLICVIGLGLFLLGLRWGHAVEDTLLRYLRTE